MSKTDQAVVHERTTTIMEYIGLIQMKDKCYGADERLARRGAPAS